MPKKNCAKVIIVSLRSCKYKRHLYSLYPLSHVFKECHYFVPLTTGGSSNQRWINILTRFLLTSSCAFSAFLSPRSNELTASFSAFTSSAGLFWDLPNSGISIGSCLRYWWGGWELTGVFFVAIWYRPTLSGWRTSSRYTIVLTRDSPRELDLFLGDANFWTQEEENLAMLLLGLQSQCDSESEDFLVVSRFSIIPIKNTYTAISVMKCVLPK